MPTDSRIGTELAGYRIEAQIGRGGMGVVYRAEHLHLGRKVALKLLVPELASNEGFRQRFTHESRLAAAIDHPHIIPLYEAGEVDGLLFITMRYVEGTDLKRLLARDGRLEPERALTMVAQLAGALDAAHARGLVHRDVKPANVLVASASGPEASEHCYLTDFGLTKDTSAQIALTATGTFVGTIDYVAPEQIQGEEQGGRVDLYSLGCVLYECLTGKLPFPRAQEVEVMLAHLQEEPPKLSAARPDLPPALDAVLQKAMAKAPSDRYGSCGEFVVAARTALAGPAPAAATRPAARAPAVAAPAPALAPAGATRPAAGPAPPLAGPPRPAAAPREREVAPPRRRAGPLIAVGVLAVAGAAAVGALLGGGGDDAEPTEPASGNVAAAGGLTVRFPSDWQTAGSPPPALGLDLTDPVTVGPRAGGAGSGLVAGGLAPDGASLLPASLIRGLGETPAVPDGVRLGAVEAFRFRDLRPAGFDGTMTLYVVPTDRGASGVACYATGGAAPTFARRCDQVAGSLELTGRKGLAVQPSEPYAKGVGALLASTAEVRERGRARLRRARTSVQQAEAADGLAGGHANRARAAKRLAVPPVAARAHAAMGAAIAAAGQGYSAMAAAARRRDRVAFAAARRRVRAADASLTGSVSALEQLGYEVSDPATGT